jgi:hypothetical protein
VAEEGKGKRRRSLQEAFGQSAPRPATERPDGAGGTGDPTEDQAARSASPGPTSPGADRSSAEVRRDATPRPRKRQGQSGRRRAARDSEAADPGAKIDGGRGAKIVEQGESEMVPGKGGKMVPAAKPVNMTFTVTAKERYLWTLELKRRGRTAVGVLRETMEGMMGEDGR